MRISKWLVAAAALACLSPDLVHSQAAAVPAPTFAVGDEWVFDHTIERGTPHFVRSRINLRIDRIDDDSMLVRAKSDGAPVDDQERRVALDWSQSRVIDGEETVTGRPFKFPMETGKTWTVEFRQPELHDGQTNTHVNITYRVVGWTDVTTPAGTFHALEIKETGSIEAERIIPQMASTATVAAPRGATTVGHARRALRQVTHNTVRGEWYYVPSIKYYVKFFEEQYNADNVRKGQDEEVLSSFKPGATTPRGSGG